MCFILQSILSLFPTNVRSFWTALNTKPILSPEYYHSMGVKEIVILFLVFALWGLAMMRFFGTWNKKMNVRVTKESIRNRDESPSHSQLEAYKSYKSRRQKTWQRTSSTMKSFRARASNFSKRARFGSLRMTASPPSPVPEEVDVALEQEPLRLDDPPRRVPGQPCAHSSTQSQPHVAAAAAAATAIGMPVHVSYEASGGVGGTPSATVELGPDRSTHSVIWWTCG